MQVSGRVASCGQKQSSGHVATYPTATVVISIAIGVVFATRASAATYRVGIAAYAC